jgi:catechol 2,3-dioxygenase-like lactoylglutathione lyase family enzyme
MSKEQRMKTERITLAVTNMAQMVAFYNSVFEAEMAQVGGSPFYKGTFARVDLLFCPNEIAEVDARQNRHQFRLAVADLDVIANRVAAVHGEVINEGEENGRKLLGVRDPDGNTYEFVESA